MPRGLKSDDQQTGRAPAILYRERDGGPLRWPSPKNVKGPGVDLFDAPPPSLPSPVLRPQLQGPKRNYFVSHLPTAVH